MSTLDADESREGIVSEPQMYQLIRQRGAVAERDFEITFHDPRARVRRQLRVAKGAAPRSAPSGTSAAHRLREAQDAAGHAPFHG